MKRCAWRSCRRRWPAGEIQRRVGTWVQMQALNSGWRDDWVAACFTDKSRKVLDCLFAAHAFGTSFKREIDRQLFNETQRRWSPVDRYAGKFADADTRIG